MMINNLDVLTDVDSLELKINLIPSREDIKTSRNIDFVENCCDTLRMIVEDVAMMFPANKRKQLLAYNYEKIRKIENRQLAKMITERGI